MDIKFLEYPTMQAGWEGINEYLLLQVEEIYSRGGDMYSTEMISHDNYIYMRRGWIDPNFNFGRTLGYAKAKWSSLIGNYVDMKYLDLLRHEITHRVKKKSDSYNYAFHFSNHHGHGKDCLISLQFSKRVGEEEPVLIFNIRTSEVTKRLLWDFLLVQRIGEYVYGHNKFAVMLFAPSMYITCESILMYHNVKDLYELIKTRPNAKMDKFQERTMKTLTEYLEHPDPDSIKYRVHRRSCMQIQRDEEGNPISGVKDLFAKDLYLAGWPLDVPKEAISKKQLRKHALTNG